MLLFDAVNDFLEYCRHEKGYSKTSCKSRLSLLRALILWMQANGYPEPHCTDLETPMLRRYLHALSKRGLRPRTIHANFYHIKCICLYLIENKVLDMMPVDGIKLPKLDSAGRLTISNDEIEMLLQAATHQRDTRRIAMCSAVLHVFIYGALRRHELIDLKVSDIDAGCGSILVRLSMIQ
jgi:site-specific recombinase XerD